MHLTPHETDKLALHQAGFLAQKRLARGLRLNHPEAVALIATQVIQFIRDGRSVAEHGNLKLALYGRFLPVPARGSAGLVPRATDKGEDFSPAVPANYSSPTETA